MSIGTGFFRTVSILTECADRTHVRPRLVEGTQCVRLYGAAPEGIEPSRERSPEAGYSSYVTTWGCVGSDGSGTSTRTNLSVTCSYPALCKTSA